MSRAAVRLGVIGCGRAALRHHLPVVARAGFTVTALADVDPAALAAAGRFAPAAARLTSWQEALRHCDAVLVATPTPLHCEQTLGALEAGCAVLLEKPVAMDQDECRRILAAAERARRPVLAGHNTRFHPLAAPARAVVQSGVLGRLTAVRSTYTHAHGEPGEHWHRRRATGGGVLLNDGVHHFDLWRFLTGAEIQSLSCQTADTERFEDDTVALSARLSNGALATLLLSFSATPQSEVEIFGDQASLLVSLYRFDGLQLRRRDELPGSARTRLRELSRFLAGLPGGLAALAGGGGHDSSYAALWQHFGACCRGQAEPLCSMADGAAAVAAARAAMASARD